ncbi:MAG: type II secretion system ATPase GspE [Desulfobacteraceae bacterium]|nr:type II secretion system ATPase GspE [Desulfobacteraceae bacterium]
MTHRLIGEILKETCTLSEDALDEALKIQKEKGGRIGEILVRQKAISKVDLLEALSIQFDLPFSLTLPIEDLKTGFTEKVPIQFLKKHKIIPIITSNGAHIAANDPLLFQPLDDLRLLLGLECVEVVLALETAIISAINFTYDLSHDSAEQFVQDMHEEDTELIMSEIEEIGDLLEDNSVAPIIKLVNLMMYQAVKERASDIHIEPAQKHVKIRYRVDGILYDKFSPPKRTQSTLISRIKVMAKMNIAEKRLPQDGRIEIRIAEKNIDIRASTIPTAFGERAVLRLLDKTNVLMSVSDLGMSEYGLKEFDKLTRSAHGIVLVTGPTGSGKTTTLYGALSTINKPDINIITIEDPIEYQIEGIGQIQVNPKIGLTFAKGLRSIVRQDPDVILVGEIRDLETAEIAIQSALTGHLVFSTLHTNDSASAVTRLINMGIEPYLITSSVIAILAQRLVRIICDNCKEEYTPSVESLQHIGITAEMAAGKKIYRVKGCPSCLDTGYRGRIGIFELMILDDTVRSQILRTSDAKAIRHTAIEQGMTTLLQDGAQKVLKGITTIEEVFRVTY